MSSAFVMSLSPTAVGVMRLRILVSEKRSLAFPPFESEESDESETSNMLQPKMAEPRTKAESTAPAIFFMMPKCFIVYFSHYFMTVTIASAE